MVEAATAGHFVTKDSLDSLLNCMFEEMASSSIEVMGVGGGEVKVMLMDDSAADDDEGQMHTIITASNAQGQMISAVEPQPASSQDEVQYVFHVTSS
ncbi:hypothetical protein Hamer_G009271 [Homarus americanus]|uniref:Uncharacterized protein n=1 Tax=Homarus americanus TaxID=6706 RepID=A0A8J5MJC8_HOMAM|nr:hypothetical protein Hamer_G009271 [Homarus americanus]